MSNGEYLFSKVLRPHDATAQVERHDLTGAEPGEEQLTAGDRSRSGEVVFFVERRERAARLELVFPAATTVGSTEGFDDQEDRIGGARWRFATAAQRSLARYQRGVVAGQRRMRAAAQGHPADLRGHEDLIAPDDWRRRSEPAKRDAPRDVLALAPRGRQAGFGRHPETGWAAPLRPVRGHRRSSEQNSDRNEDHPHVVTVLVAAGAARGQGTTASRSSTGSARSSRPSATRFP